MAKTHERIEIELRMNEASAPSAMNYFNYFTEIEEEFVKRRGSHMMVSPLDWTLIETWKQRGIPLYIVLRGINSSFDGYNQRLNRGRKINSLFFCQQEVEALFQEYIESRVGAVQSAGNGAPQNGNGDSQFTPAAIADFLKGQLEALWRLEAKHLDPALKETFARISQRLSQIIEDLEQTGALSPELLEMDLMMIEEVALDGLREHAGEENIKQLRKEANNKLRSYKQSMEREVYEQTINNFVAQRLREQYQVPRLSLFYL
ncbi:MAG: hypothetical protein JMDDDDMK_05448 [Acidobacteria bacterium]|nr:hypothetical protein [Acidobacteriota bacterium]